MKAIEIQAINHLRRRSQYNLWKSEIPKEMWSSAVLRNLWLGVEAAFKEEPHLKLVTVQQLSKWVDAHSFRDRGEYPVVLGKLRKAKYDPKDMAVRTFLQRTRFKMILEEGIAILGEPSGLSKLSVVRDEIDSIVRLAQREAVKPVAYFGSVGKRLSATRQGVVSTGLSPTFDELCGGGSAVGELHIFLGATNVGKTAMLCNLAAGALRQGLNVVYLTLDDCNAMTIARRVDQILLGVPEAKILTHPAVFKKKMEQLRTNSGDMRILDYNDKDVSILEIRGALENLAEDGFKPDLLCVDYLDVMVSSDSTKDEQRVFLQICRGLKKIAREFESRVWTAGQGNRQAIDAQDIKLSQMAGAIAKAKSADVIYGLNQTPDERAEGLMRVTCLRSRSFQRWTQEVWFNTDWSTMRITQATLGDTEEEEES